MTIFQNTLFFLAVGVVVSVGAVDTCPALINGAVSVYEFDKVPFECTPDGTLANCADDLCSCLRPGSKMEGGQCTGTGFAGVDCLDVSFCARLYAICLAVASNAVNNSCSEWGDYFQNGIKDQIEDITKSNETALYSSCENWYCNYQNATWPHCSLATPSVCRPPISPKDGTPAPLITIAPGNPASKPIPTTVNGKPAVPVTRISAVVVLTGDFSSLFLPGAQAQAALERMKKSVGDAFTARLKRLYICLNLEQGSLVATVATDVPQGTDAGSKSAVTDNLKSINDDTSNDWLAGVVNACQAGGGCSTGVGAPTVRLSSITETNIAADSNPPVQSKCGSGCVAGIIIACVAIGIIITAAVVITVRKSSQGTGQKANEPTEMENGPASSAV